MYRMTLLSILSENVAARRLRTVTGKASICDTLNTLDRRSDCQEVRRVAGGVINRLRCHGHR